MEKLEVKFKKVKEYKNVYSFFLGDHEIGGIKLNRRDPDHIYFYGNDKNNMKDFGVGLRLEELEEITGMIRKFIEKEKLRKFGVEI